MIALVCGVVVLLLCLGGYLWSEWPAVSAWLESWGRISGTDRKCPRL